MTWSFDPAETVATSLIFGGSGWSMSTKPPVMYEPEIVPVRTPSFLLVSVQKHELVSSPQPSIESNVTPSILAASADVSTVITPSTVTVILLRVIWRRYASGKNNDLNLSLSFSITSNLGRPSSHISPFLSFCTLSPKSSRHCAKPTFLGS